MQRRSREENETGMCGTVNAGERAARPTCDICKPRVSLHLPLPVDMAPRNFFPQSFFKVMKKKKGHWCPGAGTAGCLPKGRWQHSSTPVPGLIWESVLFLTPPSYVRKRIEKKKKKKASQLSAPFPFPSLTRAFPSKGEEEDGALPGSGLGTLAQAACQWSLCHTGTPSIKMASLCLTNMTVTLNTSYGFH